MATQYFKRNLLLNLYREGKKIQCVSSCSLLLLLLLSHFSRVRLCATPQTAAHQAPPSLGFLRERKMSDTCSLFPPFGDPWPSCLLLSQVLQRTLAFIWNVEYEFFFNSYVKYGIRHPPSWELRRELFNSFSMSLVIV